MLDLKTYCQFCSHKRKTVLLVQSDAGLERKKLSKGVCVRVIAFLPMLETLWKQQQHIHLSLLHSSTDHRCKAELEIICKRQGSWTKKFAPAVLFQCVRTVVESNTDPPSLIQHTTAEREQQVKQQQPNRRQGNGYIKDLDISSQLDHLKSLQVQGRWLEWSQQMWMDLNWNSLIYNWTDAEL